MITTKCNRKHIRNTSRSNILIHAINVHNCRTKRINITCKLRNCTNLKHLNHHFQAWTTSNRSRLRSLAVKLFLYKTLTWLTKQVKKSNVFRDDWIQVHPQWHRVQFASFMKLIQEYLQCSPNSQQLYHGNIQTSSFSTSTY